MCTGEYWTSADIVDCIVSYTVTQLMDIMTDANSREGLEMLAKVCTLEASHAHTKGLSPPPHHVSLLFLVLGNLALGPLAC